jgi:hypothetical protein
VGLLAEAVKAIDQLSRIVSNLKQTSQSVAGVTEQIGRGS